jgi:indole-3-glycerol phosphate synthase
VQAPPLPARGRVHPWTPPSGTLGRLVEEARTRAAALEGRRAAVERAAADAAAPLSFAAALLRRDVAVIAEVKRRSPSKGEIAPGLGAGAQGAAYERGGAAALSILTEPAHFGGAVEDLLTARGAAALPLLRKDFLVSELQLAEARANGASAALLIARALEPRTLHSLVALARDLALEPLVEVRDERELEEALGSGALVIGVNNRDLETLVIDPATCDRILPLVPGDRVAVAESGISTRDDVARYAAGGADAVLVGSSVSASPDPEAAVRALTGVPRAGRAA